MFAAASKLIAPGFHCRNESDIPILFVFSQLSPLHWHKVILVTSKISGFLFIVLSFFFDY
jgi:hypothetical protein